MRVSLRLERLQQLIAQSSLSQNHWAIKFGLSKGHLSDLLAGKHPYPSARTRDRLLEVLGVPFAELFEIEPGHELPDYAIQRALHRQYAIDREIGHGGMGTVYLARDLRLGRTVAIKIVSEEVVSGVGGKALLKEIVNTNRLQHPNVLTVLDAGEAAGAPYYVMPYVRGGSLRDLLKRGERLPVGRALGIISGIAAALDHAHSQSILHCDVKPANVLLSDDHPWLIDFGIARVIQTEVFSGEWHGEYDSGAGTPAYVSPEQARGDRGLDGRTDVYSLACLTFETLAGRPPFEGSTTLATVGQRFAESPPDLCEHAPHVPTELADVLRRAMAIERETRTASAGEFVHDCRRAIAAAGSVVGVPSAVAPVRPSRRWRIAQAAGALMRDIRFAVRNVIRTPGVAVAVALTLGLGVGVNAMMFGILDRLFFRPPSGIGAADAVRRVYVDRPRLGQDGISGSLSYPELEDLRRAASLQATAGYFSTLMSEGRGEGATRVSALYVTHDFFPTLQAFPFLGRFFDGSEDQEGAAGAVVLGYTYWRTHFFASSQAIGRVLQLGSGSYTVIGVAPPGFTGVDLPAIDVFVPLRAAAHENIGGPWQTSRGIRWLHAVTRLSSGVSPAAAAADATIQLRAGQQAAGRREARVSAVVAPLLAARGPLARGEAKVSLWLGGFALVLLVIACANVVNLLLTRMMHRDAELAIRAALGASRGRILSQVVVEMSVLALLASGVGLLLAQWGGAVLARTVLPGTTWSGALTDPRVVMFTAVVALTAGLLAGVGPAWRSARPNIVGSLKVGRGGAASHRSRLRSTLLVFQAALSVVVLVAAGLFVRSMNRIRHVDAGLDLDHLVAASIDFDAVGLPPAAAAVTQAEAIRFIERLPGVAGVTGSNVMTFQGNWAEALRIPGVDTIPVPRSGGPYINIVGPDYFRLVGTRIVSGRGFTADDRSGHQRVAVVGATMARLIWHGESPIGKCMRIGGDTMPCTEIVGVAHDAPRSDLLDTENAQYYVPAAQYSPGVPFNALYIRTTGDPARLVSPVRRLLSRLAPEMPYVSAFPLWQLTESETRPWRLGATLFTISGGLAMLVAALGLYSLLSFSVARRSREFGIRAALGATMGDVVTEVLGDGMRLVAVGLTLGVLASLAGSRWLAPLLYETSPRDPVVLLTVGVTLLAAALGACLIPAVRATRVDPVKALRAE
jgi:putative ABC transport system permease protein